MSYDIGCIDELGQTGMPDSPETWVREVLESDQLTEAKMRYGRKKLTRGTLVLLWGLRVYVVFMVVIICMATWNALHTPG